MDGAKGKAADIDERLAIMNRLWVRHRELTHELEKAERYHNWQLADSIRQVQSRIRAAFDTIAA